MIKRLLRLVGRWARKAVNHTSWVALVTPTDRPKSVRNRCLIELFCGVVCVVTLPFWLSCWCRGFCHRTESDLFLFLLNDTTRTMYRVQGIYRKLKWTNIVRLQFCDWYHLTTRWFILFMCYMSMTIYNIYPVIFIIVYIVCIIIYLLILYVGIC